jgi:hypothetical protein
MSEASHLAEALEGLLATPDLSWFVSYPAAVDGLTAEQAARAPGPRFNSVWGVTLHLTVCQQFALAVLRDDALDVNTFFVDGVWPLVRDPQDAAAWQKAKADLLAVNHALAECVAGLSAEALRKELPYVEMKCFQYIQGQLAHNSNHLCEIVAIRHMQGLWLEYT